MSKFTNVGRIQNKIRAKKGLPIMGEGFTMGDTTPMSRALTTTAGGAGGMFGFLKDDLNALKSAFGTYSSAREQGTKIGTAFGGARRHLMSAMGEGGAMRLGAYGGTVAGAGVGAVGSDEGFGNTAMGMALGAAGGAGAGAFAGHHHKAISQAMRGGYQGAKLQANNAVNKIKSRMKG